MENASALVVVVLLVVLTAVPLRIGASLVRARRRNFGYALLGTLAMGGISRGLESLGWSPVASGLVLVAVGGALLALIHGTGLLRGMLLAAGVIVVHLALGRALAGFL